VPEVTSGRIAAGLALAIALASSVVHAAPPDTNACITAFDQGQRLRSDRKLRRAQTELLVCTQESCPALLRADCAGVLRTVQSAVPTVVLAADDGAGHDLTDVKVQVGNEVIAPKLDGRAIEFDPGTYDFRFERAGAPPITVHQVLREGEKNRAVRASFAKKPSAASTVITAPSPPEPPSRDAVGYAVPIGLGVVGVAALAASGISRLSFDSSVDEMRARCAPECTQAERADLSSTLVTANVSLAIGIGAVVLGAASWFLLDASGRGGQKRVGTATPLRWAW
jgi:hypothetical protein